MRYKIILLVTSALIATGCDRAAEGQSVAVINGEEITSSELNGELGLANIAPSFDKKTATSQVLQAMIDRRLLAQQARSDGLDRSPEFLSRQRRATEDLLISMLAARKLKSTKLPTPAETASFQASRPEMFGRRENWSLEQIQFETPSDPKITAQIMGSRTLSTLAEILGKNGVRYSKATTQVNSAIVPHEMYQKIAALPPGEIFIVPAGAQSVANVIVSREPAPLGDAATRPVAVAALRQAQGAKLMEGTLKDLRTKAKIEYKEGFAPKK